MRSGSQSNRAPAPLAASPACPLAPSGLPSKPLTPGPPLARRCGPRKTPVPFGYSNFFLGDQNARSGPFIRGKFRGNPKAAGPRKIAAARQHRPAVTFPPADVFPVQQALQLVVVSVTPRSQSVSGAPIAQKHRETQPVAVQDRPMTTSFPPLGRPVNHPEAEYAP